MATELLYMEDFDVVSCEATVIDIQTTEDGQTAIILDQTCFYPRGGGQDWDTGQVGDGFQVDEVRLDEAGTVHHIGHGRLAIGERVVCKVTTKRRHANTRLHSAGHVIDMAMSEIMPELVPAKGAHYPHMSFVEYAGTTDNTEALITSLQAKINEILAKDVTNTLRFVGVPELNSLCRHVPDNLPSNKPVRVVLYGGFGVPCGGTHVRNLKDIGKIELTKVKSKKGLTKVSYRVEGIN
ncbi:MAG TPA: alanine--tRNA ligase-related protein [Candidatus Limnocylindrales bacterium]|nr:alanine--tRNA ligase-related protein [Candidatus Limnocylindrales bacterium]